jgi:signal transduction histidine kinase
VPVSPEEVLNTLRESTLATLAETGFDIEFCVTQALPEVLADRQALLRSLQNLVDNAVKYSGVNRWIKICADLHRRADEDCEVNISVSDHGLGIASSELQHIFEPFYRGSRAVTAQIHGSGLGLSVVAQSLEAMGARISVESEVGKGTVFTIHLQVADLSGRVSATDSQEVFT